MKMKWFLNKTWDMLVLKYFGKFNFVFYFLQQADWGAIMFGSWVDIISNHCLRLPETLQGDFEKT